MELQDMNERLGPTSGQVVAQAARNVALLNAIESTVKMVASNMTIIRSMNQDIIPLIERIEAYDGESLLDPDGRAAELLVQAAHTAKRLYDDAIKRCEAAKADRRLCDDDGVAAVWSELTTALADYHNNLEDLRDHVETADSLKSPRGRVYTDVGSLLADLGV
jgi:hypothetical protein